MKRSKTRFWLITLMFMLLLNLSAYADTGENHHYENLIDIGHDQVNWMRMIRDDVQISRINMPVSHDAGCYHMKVVLSDMAKTQDENIYRQLCRGVRVLDIRLGVYYDDPKHEPYEMRLHHAPSNSEMTSAVCYNDKGEVLRLGEVMRDVERFLRKNPSETVVMYVTDHQIGRPYVMKNLKVLEEEYYYDQDEKNFEYKPYSLFRYYKENDPVPELGKVRGNCVMIYVDDTVTSYFNESGEFQDDYETSMKNAVMKTMNMAQDVNFSKKYGDVFKNQNMNYLSHPGQEPMVKTIGLDYNGGFSVFPKNSACELDWYFGEEVTYTSREDRRWQSGKRYGWIKLDFVTNVNCTKLIENIIRSNQGTTLLDVTIHNETDKPLGVENIRLFSNKPYLYLKEEVDLSKYDVACWKSGNEVHFTIGRLPYLDENGDRLDYSVEYEDATIAMKQDEDLQVDVLPYTEFVYARDSGLRRDVAVSCKEKISYTMTNEPVETTDLLFKMDIPGYQDECDLIKTPEDLVKNLGTIILRQMDSAGHPLRDYKVTDLAHTKGKGVPYLDYEELTEREDHTYTLKISGIPLTTGEGEKYRYAVKGVDNSGKYEIGEQNTSLQVDGEYLVILIMFSEGEKTRVSGEIEWFDKGDVYLNRGTAIEDLIRQGVTLTTKSHLVEPVVITDPDAFSTTGNTTAFYGYIDKFDKNHNAIDPNEYVFELPDRLQEGMYQIYFSESPYFSYKRYVKTDLQISFDEAMITALGDNYESRISSLQVPLESSYQEISKLTLRASIWQENRLVSASDAYEWIQLPQYNLDVKANTDLIEAELKKIAGLPEYEISRTAAIERNEQNEAVIRVKVFITVKTDDVKLVGTIKWQDGDLLIDHKDDYQKISFTIYRRESSTRQLKEDEYTVTWDENRFTITINNAWPTADYYIGEPPVLDGYEAYDSSEIMSEESAYTFMKMIDLTGAIGLIGTEPFDMDHYRFWVNYENNTSNKASYKGEPEIQYVSGSYLFRMQAPISNRFGDLYTYDVTLEVTQDPEKAYHISYSEPRRDPETGAFDEVIDIYNTKPAELIQMPVKLYAKGKNVESGTYHFVAKGYIGDEPYQRDLYLSKENDFYGKFDLEDLEVGEYDFQIYQIPAEDEDIIFDTHISNVHVSNGAGFIQPVIVYDEQFHSTGKDTSEFTNITVGPILNFTHEVKYLVPEGIRFDDKDFIYELTCVNEDGTETLIEKAAASNMGENEIESQNLEFSRLRIYEEGTYTYKLKSYAEQTSGWLLDQKEYPITVTLSYENNKPVFDVKYDGQDNLTVSHIYSVAEYEVPYRLVTEQPEDMSQVGSFQFVAEHKRSGSYIFTNCSKPGDAVFEDKLYFYEPGEETITIRQTDAKSDWYWFYDTAEKKQKVIVERAADGSLKARMAESEEIPVFTNKLAYQPVPITVYWNRDEGKEDLRPQELRFELWDDHERVTSAEIKAEDGWTGETGSVYLYTYSETEGIAPVAYQLKCIDLPKEAYAMEISGNAFNGYVVNFTKMIPKQEDLEIDITWDDNHDAEGLRPEDVQVKLASGIKEIDLPDPLTLTEDTNWKGIYKNLQKTYFVKDDQDIFKEIPIVYEIVPVIPEHYKVTFATDNEGIVHLTCKLDLKDMSDGIQVSGYTGKYDGDAHGIVVSLSGFAEGAQVLYGTKEGKYTQSENPTFTGVGTHTVYYKVTKDGFWTVKGKADVVIRHTIYYVAVQVFVNWDDGEYSKEFRPDRVQVPLIEVKGDAKSELETWTVTKDDRYTADHIWRKYKYLPSEYYDKEGIPRPILYQIDRDKAEEVPFYEIYEADNLNYQEEIINLTYRLKLEDMSDGIQVSGFAGEYDEKSHGIKVDLSGSAEGAQVRYGTKEGEYTLSSSPVYDRVGTHTVYYQVTKKGYVTVTGKADVEIHHTIYHNAVEVIVNWNDEQDRLKCRPDQVQVTLLEVKGDAQKELEVWTIRKGDKYTADYLWRKYKYLPSSYVDETGIPRKIIYQVNTEKAEQVPFYEAGEPEYEEEKRIINLTYTLKPGDMSDGIQASGFAGKYDEKLHGIEVSLSGLAEGAQVFYGTQEGEYTLSESPMYDQIGSYTVYYQVTKKGYETVTGSRKVVIRAAEKTQQNLTAKTEKTSLLITETTQISAESTDPSGEKIDPQTEEITYRFESSDPSVAAVDADGKVTAVGAGTAKIMILASEGIHYDAAQTMIEITVSEIGIRNITITAKWVDDNDKTRLRPANIKAGLMEQKDKDSQKLTPLTLSADQNWTGTYEKLPTGYMGEDGKLHSITYQIETFDAEFYEMEAKEESQDHYILTYTLNLKDMSAGVKAKGFDGNYDGKAHSIEVTLSEEAKDAAILYGTKAGSCTEKISPTYTEPGTYTVYYKVTKRGYQDVTGSEKVVIRKEQKKQQEVTASAKMESLQPKETTKITPVSYNQTGEKINAAEEKITYTYSSSNSKIAKVDQSGNVTAVKAGKVQITVRASEGTHYLAAETKVTITVTKAAPKENINKDLSMKLDRTGLTITWTRLKEADGYDIFLAKCEKAYERKTPTVSVKKSKKKIVIRKLNGEKLDQLQAYKAYIKAYKMKGTKKVYLQKSKDVHCVSKQNTKYTNAKSVKLDKKTKTLRVGRTFKIRAKIVNVDKKKRILDHVSKFRYWSMDKSVAVVNSKGVVKAKGEGKTRIYVMALNGQKKSIEVTVKK